MRSLGVKEKAGSEWMSKGFRKKYGVGEKAKKEKAVEEKEETGGVRSKKMKKTIDAIYGLKRDDVRKDVKRNTTGSRTIESREGIRGVYLKAGLKKPSEERSCTSKLRSAGSGVFNKLLAASKRTDLEEHTSHRRMCTKKLHASERGLMGSLSTSWRTGGKGSLVRDIIENMSKKRLGVIGGGSREKKVKKKEKETKSKTSYRGGGEEKKKKMLKSMSSVVEKKELKKMKSDVWHGKEEDTLACKEDVVVASTEASAGVGQEEVVEKRRASR